MIYKNIVINCPESEPARQVTLGDAIINYVHGDMVSLRKNLKIIQEADVVVLFEQPEIPLFCWPKTSDEVKSLLVELNMLGGEKIHEGEQRQFVSTALDFRSPRRGEDAATYAYRCVHPKFRLGNFNRFMKKFACASVTKIVAPIFHATEHSRSRDVLVFFDCGLCQTPIAKSRFALMTELFYTWHLMFDIKASARPEWGRLNRLVSDLELPQSPLFDRMPSPSSPFVKNMGKNAEYQLLRNSEHQPVGIESHHWTTHVAFLDMPVGHSKDLSELMARFIGVPAEHLFHEGVPVSPVPAQQKNTSSITASECDTPMEGRGIAMPMINVNTGGPESVSAQLSNLSVIEDDAREIPAQRSTGSISGIEGPLSIIENEGEMPPVMPPSKPISPTPDVIADVYRKAKEEVEHLLKKRGLTNPLLGESSAMLRMYPSILDTVNHFDTHVLIYGETGSGKAMIYELIRRISRDQNRPFLIPTLTGLADTHLISTVFGHVKGAFTDADASRKGAVELATGGTLVLDNLQAENKDFFNKFLRVLEPGQPYQGLGAEEIRSANCRIIAGSNRPIEELLKSELPADWPARFPIMISIPCLDDRKDDIPELVKLFTKEYFEKCEWLSDADVTLEWLDEKCASKLGEWIGMSWHGSRGNVRGLRQEVETHLRSAVRFIKSKPHVKKVVGNPRTIPPEELNRILIEAVAFNLSWPELQKRLVVQGTEDQVYSTLKALRNRVSKNKPIIDPKVQEYVESLEDAAVQSES